MTVQEYVVGFLLDDQGRVVLIEKNRPAWQAGRLNGVGGHVEPWEHPADAMHREFREETGVPLLGWQEFVTMRFPGAVIHFYRLRVRDAILESVRTMTDEEVGIHFVCRAAGSSSIVPNLSWLLPLAAYTADEYEPIEVKASMAEVLT